MPVIADQNFSWKNADHRVAADWPDDCTVQWGDRGVVMKGSESYRTAFFEAFPREGGFFRGEGGTIFEAEANCFEKFRRFNACDHRWGRRNYTNGGAICYRCGAFKSVFKPIPRLGKAMEPLSIMELDSAMSGFLRPLPREDARMARHRRWTILRLRLFGVALPETPGSPQPDAYLLNEDNDPYITACRRAVIDWYRENRDKVDRCASTGMAGVFDRLAEKNLDQSMKEETDDL